MKKQWKLILEELDKLHEQTNEALTEADDDDITDTENIRKNEERKFISNDKI